MAREEIRADFKSTLKLENQKPKTYNFVPDAAQTTLRVRGEANEAGGDHGVADKVPVGNGHAGA